MESINVTVNSQLLSSTDSTCLLCPKMSKIHQKFLNINWETATSCFHVPIINQSEINSRTEFF